MKVVLLYVGIGVAGFNSNRPLGDREGGWIGHGIASIGASLLQAGYDVELIDLRQLGNWEDFIWLITKKDADVYGLSISPVDGQLAPSIAKIIKHIHPQSRIIVGGIHPTIFPERYLKPEIDTVVLGEGELTFVSLLQDLQKNRPWPKQIQGCKPNLTDLPFVARELFDYRRELACNFAPDQATPSITMLAGRGCPFKCTYCQPAENAIFGSPFRIRSVQSVMKELIQLRVKYGFKSVTFWDDTFTFSKKWIKDFCEAYKTLGFNAKIAACSRADIICKNEEMIEQLANIGLDWFVIGFESGSQRLLDLIKKGTTVEQNLKAAQICRKYGIKIFGTYMYGLPTETKAESLATAIMMDKIAPEHDSPFYFVPIEGTDIYNLCIRNDLILKEVTEQSIARTGVFAPALKWIDYEFLDNLRSQRGKEARQLLRRGVQQLDEVFPQT